MTTVGVIRRAHCETTKGMKEVPIMIEDGAPSKGKCEGEGHDCLVPEEWGGECSFGHPKSTGNTT